MASLFRKSGSDFHLIFLGWDFLFIPKQQLAHAGYLPQVK
jgi:hypothetical protein